MNTFNLGIVFPPPKAAVVTIVCASEDMIDPQEVIMIAQANLPVGLATCSSGKGAINYVAKKIKEECGCEAVTVFSDSVFLLQDMHS